MSYTKGKWEIILATDSNEYAYIVSGSQYIVQNIRIEDAKRICQCVNEWDEVQQELANYKEACEGLKLSVQELRPYAECYKQVCQRLSIEKDILGFVRELREQRDALLEACKNLLSEIDKPDYPTHTGMVLVYKDGLKAAIAAAEKT